MSEISNPEQPQVSAIVIRFVDPTSALFQISIQNLSPVQVLMAAELLMLRAKDQIMQQERQAQEEREAQMIAKPNPGIAVAKGRF